MEKRAFLKHTVIRICDMLREINGAIDGAAMDMGDLNDLAGGDAFVTSADDTILPNTNLATHLIDISNMIVETHDALVDMFHIDVPK